MRIYTHIEYIWTNGAYKLDKEKSIWYTYNGPIESACGATKEQKAALTTQTDITKTLQGQLASIFGASSNVFQDLNNTFAPIVAAGPNQQGFSAAELSNLQSQAITNTGQQYNNAKQAVGERTAAMGGGNIALPSGAAIAPQLTLAADAAAQTSGELSQINQADYAQGRQNWITAASGLAGAPSVFNPATGAAGVLNTAAGNQAKQANEVAQSQNSWINGLIGAGSKLAGMIPIPGAGALSAFGSMTAGDISSIYGGSSGPETIDQQLPSEIQ